MQFQFSGIVAHTALKSSIPGRLTRTDLIFSNFLLVSWFIICAVYAGGKVKSDYVVNNLECIKGILGYTFLPSILIFFLINKNAPLKIGLTSFFSTISSGIISNLIMVILCKEPVTSHVIIFHFMPTFIYIFIFTNIALFFFKWETKINKFKKDIS